MKINYLQISNVLSFAYHPNIATAPKITVDKGLNLLIGHNGSGKSTVLETLNLIFRNHLFAKVTFNEGSYNNRATATADQTRNTLALLARMNYSALRLEPNWDFPSQPQTIRIEVELDQVDVTNLQMLTAKQAALQSLATKYSSLPELRLQLPAYRFPGRLHVVFSGQNV